MDEISTNCILNCIGYCRYLYVNKKSNRLHTFITVPALAQPKLNTVYRTVQYT
jgi:hypothetical protein